jgi:ethanolamine utilization protein EutL
VISSLGEYLSREAGLPAGAAMAYLVAPPLEATLGLDAALKAADVRAVRITPPPTEINFACAWLTGSLYACEAAATAYAAAVVDVALAPKR